MGREVQWLLEDRGEEGVLDQAWRKSQEKMDGGCGGGSWEAEG